jgi:hypothetical protein
MFKRDRMACRDCDEKVTVRVMGIILYAALFSDVQWVFLSEGMGNIIERRLNIGSENEGAGCC